MFAIHYPCTKAAAWIHKLSVLKIPIRHNGNETVLEGPAGFYCSAWPDANGRAYAGACQSKGGGDCVSKSPYGQVYANGRGCTITGGRQAFGWNWNVANRRVVFQHDSNNVLHLVHVSGADTNVVFRYLNGSLPARGPQHERHRLPRRLHLAAFSGLVGHADQERERCRLHSHQGREDLLRRAREPTELPLHRRRRVGLGDLHGVADEEERRVPLRRVTVAVQGTKMTPVPYIIPGSPDEAAKRNGV